MKHNYITLKFITILLLIPFFQFSQTAISVANGNWTNPLTWNCTCVPLDGYSITINNNVTLNTSLLFSSGGITLNNSGSLVQDASLNRDIWINGGYFNNNGSANFRYFLISSGTITNPGSFTVSALTNSVSFNNTGSIKMDSMWIAGSFTNAAGAKITGDSLTVASTLINNGRINVGAITNNGTFKNYDYQTSYAFTNAANYENYDSLILTASVWNKAVFSNKTGAKFNMNKNFHNYHPSGTAVFENNGTVNVFDSWYNTDTVKGNGSFIVADTSANSGFMKGNFDFCDLTPPGSAPYVDLNSGTVSANITWCTATAIDEKNQSALVHLYPNPNNGTFFIGTNQQEVIYITNELGQQIGRLELNESNNFSSEVNGLSPGFYFLNGKNFSKKIVVLK